ncbi:hypothetical protein F4801DRAFT_593852 [Xylaria longipes]|nr:hypothetical protein F4801DRAFT_593852 [Xylaria longipes]
MDTILAEGLRSEKPYHFREEQKKEIIRSVSYYNKRNSYSVIWFPHHGIGPLLTEPFERTSDASIGYFGQLPAELLRIVLESLDIYSLFKFRQTSVNVRRCLHDTLYSSYGVVVKHGYILFCALFRTQLSAHVSLFEFYKAMRTEACATCGEFSGFISIPTWTRCCFKCIHNAPELRMQSLNSAREYFSLTRPQLDQLGSFRTLPGKYDILETPQQRLRFMVVSTHQASMISGWEPRRIEHPRQIQKFNFMVSCALPFYDTRTKDEVVEKGRWCLGCKASPIVKWEARERAYSNDGFLRHFRLCKQAQDLWELNQERKKLPELLDSIMKHDGYELYRFCYDASPGAEDIPFPQQQ